MTMTQRKFHDVKTPEFQLSFPHLFTPSQFEDEEQGSYSLVMVFDKGADLESLRAACRAVRDERWPLKDGRSSAPANLRTPFCDGDEKVDTWGENFRGTIYCRAKTKRRPPVVDARGLPVENPEAAYAGCYCRAVVYPYAYDKAGNRGISLTLAAVQILRDGERLGGDGGAARALAMFEPVAQADEDLSFSPTTLDDL
jgi:hypothetical protein